MAKRILSLVLAILILFTLCVPAFATEQDEPDRANTASILDSGNCGVNGDNVKWTLSSDGTLTISGKGAMYDYNMHYSGPWQKPSDNLKELKVIIEDGVTSIGVKAFSDCDNLISISIPDGITSIGDYAFQNCSNLSRVTIGSGVTFIGFLVFWECESLETIQVARDNRNYTSVNGVLFNKQMTELLTFPQARKGSYSIPSGVKKLGTYAFDQCSGLTEVTIPESVTAMEDCVFSECASLKSVTIPSRVTRIKTYSFYKCTSLSNLTIGRSVTEIEQEAFFGCDSLTEVSIPKSVVTIGPLAFSMCTKLTDVTILNPSCKFVDHSFLKSTTIHGNAGSAVESTANRYGYKFAPLNGEQPTVTPKPGPTEGQVKEGWVTEGGQKYYYVNGVKQKGLKTVDGRKYYFSPSTGAMLTGLVRVDAAGHICYFSAKTGYRLTGVVNTGGGKLRYFSAKDGAMISGGWISGAGTKRYYADKDGVLYTGFRTVGSKSYYFSMQDAHMMRSGVVNGPGNQQYYVAKDGHAMKNGWARGKNIPGSTTISWFYYLDKTGVVRKTVQLPSSTVVGKIPAPKPSEYDN